MVIQRWQSVFLLITFALRACFSFLSLGQVQTADVSYNFTACGFYPEGINTAAVSPAPLLTWPLFILSIASTSLAFICIFLYKKLNLQIGLALLEIILIMATIAIAYYYGNCSFENVACSWSALALAPVLALISAIFARRCMRADRRLLRSADRLR